MTLFGSLDIGRSGLNAAKAGQSISGQNIANADTEGYTRQKVINASDTLMSTGKSQGVKSEEIQRLSDQFVQKKITTESSNYHHWKTKADLLQNAELIFNDLNTAGVHTSMNEFFDAWSNLANSPESSPLRRYVIEKAESMVQQFQSYDSQIGSLQTNISEQMNSELKQMNKMINKIVELNLKIQSIEANRGNANAFKDEREQIIQKISEKFDITWTKNDLGMMDVKTAQGRILVNGTIPHEFVIAKEIQDGVLQSGIILRSKNSQTNITDEIRNGSLGAKLEMRDEFLDNKRKNLNLLFDTIASQVNEIHSQGNQYIQKLQAAEGSISFDSVSQNEPLPYLKDGVLTFKITAPSGNEELLEVPIEAGIDSMQTIVTKINTLADSFFHKAAEIPKVNPPFMSVISDKGHFQIQTNQEFSFQYGSDSTNTLSVLGINNFFNFQPNKLATAEVEDNIVKNDLFINTGKGEPGDNTLALEIAQLEQKTIMNEGTTLFSEFYNRELTNIGSETQTAIQNENLHKEVYNQYLTMRESISGVNMDEELTNMVKYQRAYEASAKYINTVDEMTQTLINL